MGLGQEVRQNYNALVNNGNIRYIVLPDAAAGVTLVNAGGDAAWAWAAAATSVVISADCGGLDPCWLAGFTICLCDHAAATTYGDLRLGSGGVGTEVWLGTFPYLAGAETAVGLGGKMPVWLPYPIRITGDPGIVGQVRNSAGAVATGPDVKVILASAVGT